MVGQQWARLFAATIFGVGACCLLSSQGAPAAVDATPQIGDFYSVFRPETGTACMVNSAQFDACVWTQIDGVVYTISYGKNESGVYVVSRISTCDDKFKTPLGLHNGDKLTIRSREDLIFAPYFEVYAKTNEQWMPVVGILDRLSTTWDPKGCVFNGKTFDELNPTPEHPIQVSASCFVKKAPTPQTPVKRSLTTGCRGIHLSLTLDS